MLGLKFSSLSLPILEDKEDAQETREREISKGATEKVAGEKEGQRDRGDGYGE